MKLDDEDGGAGRSKMGGVEEVAEDPSQPSDQPHSNLRCYVVLPYYSTLSHVTLYFNPISPAITTRRHLDYRWVTGCGPPIPDLPSTLPTYYLVL